MKTINQARMYLRVCLGMIIIIMSVPTFAQVPYTPLSLLPRGGASPYNAKLDGDQWEWLGRKRILRVGVATPDDPPFEMVVAEKEYDGMVADYLAILALNMGVQLESRQYATRALAIDALKKGEIDILSSVDSRDNAQGLLLTNGYAARHAVLIVPKERTSPANVDLVGLRLAIGVDNIPLDKAREAYPKADFQVYATTQKALSAAAFDQADAVLADSVTASYFIAKSNINKLELRTLAAIRLDPLMFAVQKENFMLAGIINNLLQAMPTSDKQNLQRRWNIGLGQILASGVLELTHREQAWMQQHSKVRVAVNGLYAPFTFFDKKGKFQGLTEEYLNLVSLQTGLKFEIIQSESIPDMLSMLENGKVEVVGAVAQDLNTAPSVLFTRPYVTTEFVLIGPRGMAFPSSSELASKRIAVPRGRPLATWLASQKSDVKLVYTNTAVDALEEILDGKADYAIQIEETATYLVNRYFKDKLAVLGIVGDKSVNISFAVAKGQPELASILDKALLAIPPAEATVLMGHWRDSGDIAVSTWVSYRVYVYRVIAAAIAILGIFFLYTIHLRHLIGKRKTAERKLGDQLAFMRTMIDGTPHPLYIRDRQARLVECNKSYLDFIGEKRESVLGKTLSQVSVLKQEMAEKVHNHYIKTMDSGEASFVDQKIELPGGVFSVYQWTLPYKDATGEVVGLIGGWLDITDRESLLEELREAKDKAEEANRAKSIFLATMSHEIRTPLSAVIGTLELFLAKADRGELQRELITNAHQSARTLLRLLSDILDLAKIEAGRIELIPERTRIRQVVEAVVGMFDGAARQQRLRLGLDIDSDDDYEVMLDGLRIKQVLANLISNAIKYTEQGQVAVHLEMHQHNDDLINIRMQVSDTGRGIHAAQQRVLFQPFSRVEDSQGEAPQPEGSGLGLSICRRLVKLMGGDIQLVSSPGVGTTVTVSLLAKRSAPLEQDITTSTNAQTLDNKKPSWRILIVEDNLPSRMLLEQQLIYLGQEVTAVENGHQALRCLDSSVFDLVITDLDMPGMSGLQLAQLIRQREDLEAHRIIVWGYTANAQREEIQRCKEAGMNDCLYKPASLDELAGRLSSDLRVREATSPPLPTFLPENIEKISNDDLGFQREFMQELLTSNEDCIDRLRVAINEENIVRIKRIAHSLYGVARLIGAERLRECCVRLETSCDSAVPNKKQVLETVFESVDSELKKLREDILTWLKKNSHI